LILKVKKLHTSLNVTSHPATLRGFECPSPNVFWSIFKVGSKDPLPIQCSWKVASSESPWKKQIECLNWNLMRIHLWNSDFQLKKEYTVFSKMVIIILLPFSTTYMCRMESTIVTQTQETSIKMETTKNCRWRDGICTVWNFSKQ
jgi:hypothetical protein